jgi:hypothetical protein
MATCCLRLRDHSRLEAGGGAAYGHGGMKDRTWSTHGGLTMTVSTIGRTVIVAAVTLGATPTLAGSLKIVNVSAPAFNCVFDPKCTVVVTDSLGSIAVPGISGSAILQSRTFAGAPRAPAAGMTGYEYRVDLTQTVGDVAKSCVTRLKVDTGPVKQLPYQGGAALADVFVVTSGGLGTIDLASADETDGAVTFAFSTPVCASAGPGGGTTSYFFGFAAAKAPRAVTAQAQSGDGQILNVAARAPAR